MTDTRNAAAEAAAEKAATEARHAPLPLPAGSFYLEDLVAIGEDALDAKPEERDALVAQRLEEANQRTDNIQTPGALPGHRVETVERVLVEGAERPVEGGAEGETEKVGEVVVLEDVQVFDREKADEEKAAADAAAGVFSATTFVDRNIDEISETELRALSPHDLTAVREAEATARNRSTLLARIDAVAGERQGGEE